MKERRSPDNMVEEWRAIPGYEGYYEVSNQGHVRRVTGEKGSVGGHVLQASDNGAGYLRLRLCANGNRRSFAIHRLVAITFLGPAQDGMEVNHRDGHKTNNTVSNLEWVSRGENNKHAFRHGLKTSDSIRGERNSGAKITVEQVLQIRALAGTISQRTIAKRFGISNGHVHAIIHGKKWAHIPDRGAPRDGKGCDPREPTLPGALASEAPHLSKKAQWVFVELRRLINEAISEKEVVAMPPEENGIQIMIKYGPLSDVEAVEFWGPVEPGEGLQAPMAPRLLLSLPSNILSCDTWHDVKRRWPEITALVNVLSNLIAGVPATVIMEGIAKMMDLACPLPNAGSMV